MPNSPKKNEEIIRRALNALRDLAPEKTFSGKKLADLEAQAERSFAPRRKLIELDNEEKRQITIRETEDKKTLKMIEQIVAGVIGDDDFGKDSALYEAFGFIRESERKTGNTRKKKTPEEVNP
jgi:hypothetical protein